jgi:hypothetical protein
MIRVEREGVVFRVSGRVILILFAVLVQTGTTLLREVSEEGTT